MVQHVYDKRLEWSNDRRYSIGDKKISVCISRRMFLEVPVLTNTLTPDFQNCLKFKLLQKIFVQEAKAKKTRVDNLGLEDSHLYNVIHGILLWFPVIFCPILQDRVG